MAGGVMCETMRGCDGSPLSWWCWFSGLLVTRCRLFLCRRCLRVRGVMV